MTRRPPRRLAIAALALLPLVGAACGGGDDEASDEPAAPGTVRVVDNEFEPATIEVAPGDTVTWSFEGSVNHNVKGEGADFASPTQKDGEWDRQFNSAGEYEYVCTLHPGMKGKVVVG
jgi:plastocyanin